jgi:hypothetical protein
MSRITAVILIPVLLTCPFFCRAAGARTLAAFAASNHDELESCSADLCSCCQGDRQDSPCGPGSEGPKERQGGNCICEGGTLDSKLEEVARRLIVADCPIEPLGTLQTMLLPTGPCDIADEAFRAFDDGHTIRILLQSLLF